MAPPAGPDWINRPGNFFALLNVARPPFESIVKEAPLKPAASSFSDRLVRYWSARGRIYALIVVVEKRSSSRMAPATSLDRLTKREGALPSMILPARISFVGFA